MASFQTLAAWRGSISQVLATRASANKRPIRRVHRASDDHGRSRLPILPASTNVLGARAPAGSPRAEEFRGVVLPVSCATGPQECLVVRQDGCSAVRLDLNARNVSIDEAPASIGCEGLRWSRTDLTINASTSVAGIRRRYGRGSGRISLAADQA